MARARTGGTDLREISLVDIKGIPHPVLRQLIKLGVKDLGQLVLKMSENDGSLETLGTKRYPVSPEDARVLEDAVLAHPACPAELTALYEATDATEYNRLVAEYEAEAESPAAEGGEAGGAEDQVELPPEAPAETPVIKVRALRKLKGGGFMQFLRSIADGAAGKPTDVS